jgi:formamidopyrimidine-DNA glycosylase
MPELPDVEVYRRYLTATCLQREITGVEARTADVVANLSVSELEEGLVGHAFRSTGRHGKYLFAHLDGAQTLIMHFGMTGKPDYFKEPADEPAYTKVLFTFANDYHLAYVAPRKLGGLRLVKDVDRFVEAKDLGPDVFRDDFSLAQFRQLLAGRRGLIKSALMDQSLMAGIGNVYSDEILFQARVHPRADVQSLSENSVKDIYEAMRWVLKTAIDHEAEPDQFPDSFLIPQRHEGGHCPGCGGDVATVKVSGRTAYYCPQCQEMPD